MAQQVKGSGIVTAVALIIAVVWVWSLSLELLHAVGDFGEKKKKKKKKKSKIVNFMSCVFDHNKKNWKNNMPLI